jgi:hypothetical protein
MRAVVVSLLMSGLAFAADAETFHGWSKDGSWLVYEQHHDERSELYFCATDSGGTPSWPAALNELDRADGTLSCVRFLDPNKAPYQWKNQLVLPAPSTRQGGVSVSPELSTDGESPGFVLVQGDKKQACFASGTRDDSKLGKTWFHPSTKYVAAMIDGNFRHCTVTLKAGKVARPKKKK